MGVTHDDQPHRLFIGQQLPCPLDLSRRGARQLAFIYGVIAEQGAQCIYQPKPEIRVQYTVDGGRDWMLDDSMDQPRLPPRLGHSVSVNRRHAAAPDPEGCPERLEVQPQVLLPEVGIPPVMVSPDHYDRHPAPEPAQRGCNVKPAPRDHPGVGEPEIEQVAVDEKAIAQLRHGVKKVEEGLFDRGRRHSKVGVGDDNEGVAEHGAKDGPTLS